MLKSVSPSLNTGLVEGFVSFYFSFMNEIYLWTVIKDSIIFNDLIMINIFFSDAYVQPWHEFK